MRVSLSIVLDFNYSLKVPAVGVKWRFSTMESLPFRLIPLFTVEYLERTEMLSLFSISIDWNHLTLGLSSNQNAFKTITYWIYLNYCQNCCIQNAVSLVTCFHPNPHKDVIHQSPSKWQDLITNEVKIMCSFCEVSVINSQYNKSGV